MTSGLVRRLQQLLFHHDARVAHGMLVALLLLAALVVAVVVAVAGPIYAVGAGLGLGAAYLALRSPRWGLVFVIFQVATLHCPSRHSVPPGVQADISLTPATLAAFGSGRRLILTDAGALPLSMPGPRWRCSLSGVVCLPLGAAPAPPQRTTIKCAEVILGVVTAVVVINVDMAKDLEWAMGDWQSLRGRLGDRRPCSTSS
ncbi:MAG: hypothetical protein H6649_09970 [Caldilineae bacterium]|nr:hypothetical protein [Caldilineae bacterium]